MIPKKGSYTRTPRVFCGVQAFSERLAALGKRTDDKAVQAEIHALGEELGMLDFVLSRLRHDRHRFDEDDINGALDRLRDHPEGGA